MTWKPRAIARRRGEALAVAAALAASCIGLAAREVAVGRSEDAAAEVAAARSDWIDAIAHARACAEATAPGSPWPARGARRLGAIARDAEARGDDVTALLAWGALRAAAIATRGLGHDGAEWRAAADHGIARVAASRGDPSLGAAAGPTSAAGDELRAALERDDAPSAGALALLAVSATAVVLGLSRLTRAGVAPAGARIAATLIAGGFLAYAAVLLLN